MEFGKPSNAKIPQAYQQDIFSEIREEDGLVIMARGLGVPHIVTSLLHIYNVAGGNFVVIIGADERENQWIGERTDPLIPLVTSPSADILSGLAEQAAISGDTKARPLREVKTDAMSIGTRFHTPPGPRKVVAHTV